jgi:hypothetical protein
VGRAKVEDWVSPELYTGIVSHFTPGETKLIFEVLSVVMES